MEKYLDHIGERLQQARTSAGLSVEDVMFRTRLPRSAIEALEAGDFSVFSSTTYAKSFLSQYSVFLAVDAHPWIDALQPAPFVPSEIVKPLWDEPVLPKKEEKIVEAASPNGWISALSVLALTTGMIFAAIKGYEFFESRFGGEANSSLGKKEDLKKPAAARSAPGVSPSLVQGTSPSKKPDDQMSQPPPRAIIVR